MRDPRRYLRMLLGTAALTVLGTALVAIDPADWGSIRGLAVLLGGAFLLALGLLTVSIQRNRRRRRAAPRGRRRGPLRRQVRRP